MRINIVTSGRFHVLDLARELSALGNEVHFYSYVRRRQAEHFGLQTGCHHRLWPFVLPFLLGERRGPAAWSNNFDALIQRILDGLAATFMRPCDVFIGMSGLCVRSAQTARSKFGARVIFERGSRHVLSQKAILEAIPGMPKPAVPEFNVRRELWAYEFADLVSIPSRHVERSFLERGFPPEKLFRNPYGVDLKMFPPTAKPRNAVPTLVFAGTWSLRKGCDVLANAVAGQPWKLIHVGAVGDTPVPNLPNIESRGFVPQSRLIEIYGAADVFVHPSREEGLSVVQAQALACGLPLVCTDRTGGEDLGEFLGDPSAVTVVPADDAMALREGIRRALTVAATQTGMRDIIGSGRDSLTWQAYGRRYNDELHRRFPETGSAPAARRNQMTPAERTND